MATAEPSSNIAEPGQQQAAGSSGESNPEAVPISSSSAWQSSGSIGPFFVVMFVLTVLTILSCYLGRRWSRGETTSTPSDSITRGRGCFGWVKRIYRECISKCVEVGSVGANKVCGQVKNDCRVVKDDEIPHQNPTQV